MYDQKQEIQNYYDNYYRHRVQFYVDDVNKAGKLFEIFANMGNAEQRTGEGQLPPFLEYTKRGYFFDIGLPSTFQYMAFDYATKWEPEFANLIQLADNVKVGFNQTFVKENLVTEDENVYGQASYSQNGGFEILTMGRDEIVKYYGDNLRIDLSKTLREMSTDELSDLQSAFDLKKAEQLDGRTVVANGIERLLEQSKENLFYDLVEGVDISGELYSQLKKVSKWEPDVPQFKVVKAELVDLIMSSNENLDIYRDIATELERGESRGMRR